jgi:glycosyltransferase involved in cell wall biosynthesis
MNENILLSIVIPTFNRAKILSNSLNNLIFDICELSAYQKVEVIISDNCSTDETNIIINSLISDNSRLIIKYNKNVENLGFDRNCIVGASLSNGKFIWFLSDDDIIKPGGLKYILKAIENNYEIKFIYLNYTLKTPGWLEACPLYLDHDMIVGCNELIITTKLNFSCVTSCVFERKAYKSIDHNIYIGTFWIHMYLVRDLAILGNSLIISEPIFTFNRPSLIDSRKSANKNKTTKIEFFIDAHINVIKYVSSFNSFYNSKAKKYAFNIVWNDNLNQILSYKLTVDKYNFKEIIFIYNEMKLYYRCKIIFWLIHVPILFASNHLAFSYFFFKLNFAKFKQFIKKFVPNKIFITYKKIFY